MGDRQSKLATVGRNRLPIDSPHSFEDIVVVWLDANINKASDPSSQILLRCLSLIVNSIRILIDADHCEQFINNNEQTLFLIVSGTLGKVFVPRIHQLASIDSIYVFCRDKVEHESWANKFSKVKEHVFNQITPLCEQLKLDICQCKNDLVQINILNDTFSRDKLNELEPEFMHSQLLKEILIKLDYDYRAKDEFVRYCRAQHPPNSTASSIIDEFDREYKPYLSVWWYSRECFAYDILNRALRTQNVDVIIKSGFFVRDLHRQIEGLYYAQEHSPITVYRGQGMRQQQFEKLYQSKGRLLSFNHFLSTSMDKRVSLEFAQRARERPDLRGVVFQMKIDPEMAHSSSPYALIDELSYFGKLEKEILFSMHTVFRIGSIRPMKDEHKIWEIDLELTSEQDDVELYRLTEYMRQEVNMSSDGLKSLGKLMLDMGELGKAEEIYQRLLERTNEDNEEELAFLYHQLGYIAAEKKDLDQALVYFSQSLTLKINYLPEHDEDPQLADTYSNIGSILHAQGHLTAALDRFQCALRTSTNNQRIQASAHHNIGMVQKRQGNSDQALISLRKSLEIDQNILPPNHYYLGQTYSNIAAVYSDQRAYSDAVIYFKTALHILSSALPANHSLLLSTNHQYKLALRHESPQNFTHQFEQDQNTSEKETKDNHNDQSAAPRPCDKLRTTVSNCAHTLKKEAKLRLNPFR